MKEIYSRSAVLLGEDGIKKLEKKKVAVFGLGGVGGYTVNALARTGIGSLVLIDNDVISPSNINRQIIANYDTIGKQKTEVMKAMVLSINPDIDVSIHNCFFLPENSDEFDFSEYDYVVDAVDTVTAKIEIISKAKAAGTNVISSMGTGNKLNPMAFEVADISKTSVCPLAKVMRKELKKRMIKDVKVVYSKELPVINRRVPGSVAFVPSVAGLLIASEVIKDLINSDN